PRPRVETRTEEWRLGDEFSKDGLERTAGVAATGFPSRGLAVTDHRTRLMVAALGFLRLEGQRPAVLQALHRPARTNPSIETKEKRQRRPVSRVPDETRKDLPRHGLSRRGFCSNKGWL